MLSICRRLSCDGYVDLLEAKTRYQTLDHVQYILRVFVLSSNSTLHFYVILKAYISCCRESVSVACEMLVQARKV